MIAVVLLCSACNVSRRSGGAPPVVAIEIPVSDERDRHRLLRLISAEAEARGFHVDAAGAADLRRSSEVSPITMNATIWRGRNDREVVASAMDGADHIGRVWLSFFAGDNGDDPVGFRSFRERLLPQLRQRWPGARTLPIMPSGAIPLSRDLVRTSTGYRVDPSAAHLYQE